MSVAQAIEHLRTREDRIVTALESLTPKESVLYRQFIYHEGMDEPFSTRVMVKRSRNGFRSEEKIGDLTEGRSLGTDARDAHQNILSRFSPYPNSIQKRCGQALTEEIWCCVLWDPIPEQA